MAKKLNLTQQPYFDDYKESNKYYQILFRPGRAVQARELTQLQTILQNQIDRFGSHIFKQGSNVIPGTPNAVRYTKTVHYIKLPLTQVYPDYSQLTSTAGEIDTAIKEIWLNKKIAITSGTRAGISGTIVGYRGPDQIGSSEVRFFLKMESSSDDGTSSTFQKGDLVTIINGERNLTATIPSTEGLNKVGVCSSVSVEEGVYFYNGYFVYVDGQTIYLAPISDENADSESYQNLWNDIPTASVGLLMTESVVTSQKDEGLLDNATGTPNYSAPGADRFSIDAKLVQIEYSATENKPQNFINLLDVVSGKVFFIADAPDYAVLADTLARRTYDQSGDYVVENLGVEVTDFLLDEEKQIRGAHQISEFQFLTEADAKAFTKQKFGVNIDDATLQPYPQGTGTVVGVNSFYYPGTSYDNRGDKTSFKSLCQSFLTLRVDPGKAYVKGYEIRKLGKTSVDVPKARTTSYIANTVVSTSTGSHIVVTDVAGNITIGNFASVDFYNLRRKGLSKKSGTGTGSGTSYVPAEYVYETSVRSDATKIGSAKIVKIEPDPDSGVGYYKVYLTDTTFSPGHSVENIKTLHASGEGFIAHAELQQFNITGSILKSTDSSTLATAYLFTGTGTGWKNFPQQILKVDDYVWLDGNSSGQQEYYRVKNIASDSSIELESEDFSGSNLGKSNQIASTTLKSLYSTINSESEDDGLIFRLGKNYVSTVRNMDASGKPTEDPTQTITTMQYTIEELYAGELGNGQAPLQTINNGVTQYSITITTPHIFNTNEYTYKVVKRTSAGAKSLMNVQNGQSTPATGTVNVFATTTPQGVTQQLTFLFSAADGAVANGNTYFIMVPVIKSAIQEKLKVLKFGSYDPITQDYINTGGQNKGVKVVDASNNSDIVLDECDVFQVTRIVASKDSATNPTTKKALNSGDVDVTALYEFDDGQKEFYYDRGRVTLKPNYQKPAGKVRVEYDYFDHVSSNNSDYFSVDSYRDIPYDEIPRFEGIDGAQYNLADCIDFRKKITDATNGKAPSEFFTCNFFHYEGRLDKLVLDSKTKNFLLVSGDPGSVSPPEDTETGMTLAELRLLPYGIGKESCLLRPRDNRRYTMRDIGRLEKRIENLEYYTSLTLLESETSKMLIRDANGNNRFKNGFLADSFTSFDSSDVDSDDFSCSISTTLENTARPLVFSDNFSLEEDLSNSIFSSRVQSLRAPTNSGNAYTKTGDLYTLPFTRTEFISQGIATKIINVNPFNIFTYVGNITLTPWSDVWRETKYIERTVYDDSDYRTASAAWNGHRNYDEPVNYPSTAPATPKKYAGTMMLEGGHIHYKGLSDKERKEADKTGMFRVPPPYLNQGELVKVNRTGKAKIQKRLKSTVTTTIKTIREYFQTEVLKTGLKTTKALTKDETTDIAFMRTREVAFKGVGFRPNANLFAFFDGRPVSKYCRPVKSSTSYSVEDVTNKTGEISILPVDSPLRYFKANNPSQFPIGTGIGKVRPGCEVEITASSGIVRKFDIISATAQYIVCQEKTREGLLASQLGSIAGGPIHTAKITDYAYGDEIQADGSGSVEGVFLIPSPNPFGIARLLVRDEAPVSIGFKTGQTQFVLSTSAINAQTGLGLSRGATNFESRGTLTTQEMTITQTQLFSVSQHAGKDESTDKKDEVIYSFDEPEYVDPIAQTFNIRETGGCFITDVEVFFARKPTSPVPIRLELRTVSNTGVPERVIVGGRLGNVIKSARDVVVNKVTISSSGANTFQVLVDSGVTPENVGGRTDLSGKIRWDSLTSVKPDVIKKNSTESIVSNTELSTISDMSSYMIPTRFTFESPIYLEQNKQYAFVLLSDSDEYEVWIAQRGNLMPLDKNITEYRYYPQVGVTNVKIGTNESIDGQNLYVEGNFFKSKNGAAWDVDDTSCMKFNIGKAKFRTRSVTSSNPNSNIGQVVYVNETLDWTTLLENALEVRPGQNQIRVLCPNHGVTVGDRVRFVIDLAEADLRGFTKNILQNTIGLEVINTELDHFTVTTGGTTAGYVASSTLAKEQYFIGAYKTSEVGITLVPTIKMRINKRFDHLTLSANQFCPAGTSIQWTIQTTKGSGVNEYSSTGALVDRDSQSKLSSISISPGVPVEFDTPMIINCPENEPAGGDFEDASDSQKRTHIQTKKSVIVKALLISDNENISPVLNQTRLSASTISNRLDNTAGVATPGKNNINNVNFDKLVIFDKNDVPTDKHLISGVVTDVARAPTAPADVLSNLNFSTATKKLTGKFKQSINSKIVEGVSGSPVLLTQVNPGDKIVIASDLTVDERTIVRVVSNNKLILNAPFTEPFNESELSLVGEYMEITTENDAVAKHLSQLDSGKYITVELYTGTTLQTTDTRSCTNKLILDVQYTPEVSSGTKCKIVVEHLNTQPGSSANSVTISQLDRYIDEIGYKGNSGGTRYICKKLSLDRSSNALKITFDGVRDEYSEFELYYRTELPNDSISIEDKPWKKAQFNIEVEGVLTPKTPEPNDSLFKSYESVVEGLQSFKGVQAKVVMRGGNSAKPPKIKNFRLIALDE